MNLKEYCKYLNISEPTIYNWKIEKPNLYNIVIEYKKEKIDNKNNLSEILKYYNLLNEKEKEYYLSDIKARVLKKEIE
ncbi:hypothetical protein [Campylobacter hyointestinalis]|uniref:Histidine kinase n=1 Tax=Campylobacter hyointestinalis subsp. hyointestinalis TaxID=91352 RepID=A0A855N8R0_CAMHY|nr:hypothetical protein [Campylobacter hyointestinalis]ANE32491.1 hypothetical protein CHH_0826 [Campylobacter hyointestinalis subsp. hyointestinalis LMG 9260]MDL2346939.1 hypothetical protein [Campylobacter hyointestinalis]MDL2348449.1 hypothetical protein [Campylobacter hyointestinalis]MDL2350426.1 hypothetical protein [Campylobacter hyointestinalis]MDM1026025.1 hypothetical protein [Campylobacter hyointestinalis]